MEFLSISEESLEKAAAVLSGGGLVSFPTETVYGLGADAFNPIALAKVFAAKNRPRFDPLIVHIAAPENLEKIADLDLLNGTAREHLSALVANFWPGPLTMILPKRKAVPDLATSGLATVAVRFPDHPVAQRLIALSTGAVAAPSANPFGCLSPTRAEHVRDMLGDKVDIILDGGPAKIGVESTVLDISGSRPRILRPGGVPREAIEALIGDVESGGAERAGEENPAAQTPGMASPGLLKSHYAPKARLTVFSAKDIAALPPNVDETSAFLFFDGSSRAQWLAAHSAAFGLSRPVLIRTLSENGGDPEAAANLFGMLHELDRLDISRIYAQLAPERGLGVAINDRLRRAGGLLCKK